ncbi:wax ester/triacylglycerol synthase family O-acyltransferase [Nocardia sp. 348MFTsu5.1]|uniref:wax ester/triacylglycerol synthase family O-acyltransferase n=1 Tax=Nocardia sp. 348MFTsu5.1 TaxID=1172185 RepID=UPI00039B3948|nr:wax ester/triacylglycerol synthase family O-acyltransferase [Nocardia sp. 348MFTsu5.1]
MNRLSPQDSMYYYLDDRGSTTQVGSLLILERRAGGLDYQGLLRTVESRLQLVPRYRKKIREVTLGLARPVWVDDREFDITYHVRRSALPSPGADDQLHDLVARLMSRPLERTRPLWEMYLVEGLSDDRMAILTKTHRALVDGSEAFEINQIIVDDVREPPSMPEDLWLPDREPGSGELVVGAITDVLTRPWEMVDQVRAASNQLASVGQVLSGAVRRVESVMKMATTTAPPSPLNGSTAPTRRFTVASCSADDCVDIAERHGCSPNDVLLASIAGAIRRWLLSRSQAVDQVETVRVMVPLSAYPAGEDQPEFETDLDAQGESSSASWMVGGLQGFVTDLPVGEPNPVVRLSQVAQLAERHSHSNRNWSAAVEPWIPEIGPATFHAMSARATASLSRRSFNVPVTIARGPRSAQYLGGNEILAIYPVPVLVRKRALAIGITSYNGRICFGFNADRGVMWDLGAMAEYLTDSFEELLPQR